MDEIRYVLKRLFQRRVVLIATVTLLLIALLAFLFPLFSSADPNEISVLQRLKEPSFEHWAGTDELGRDLATRIIWGGRYSILIGLSTAIFSSIAGTILGLMAGFFRRLDAPIMRVIDAMMSFPDILLGISLVSILSPSLWNVVLALSIVYTPRIARVVRASTLVIRELLFVDAARALGVSTPRILYAHILPNLMSPILVQFTFIFAYAILAEAGLSFLGVGVPPEIPTWGTMIASGLQYADRAFWIIVFPGIVIILTALSLQIVGDGVRDMLDPKLRKSA